MDSKISKFKYKYYIEDLGQTIEDAIVYESTYSNTPAYIAEDAAKHYFHYCCCRFFYQAAG